MDYFQTNNTGVIKVVKGIVIVDSKWGISKSGEMLFHLKTDLVRFRQLTLGNSVIVGRSTLHTFPGGKPLEGRVNYVLSRTMTPRDDAIVCRSLEELLGKVPKNSWVLGGGSVYDQLLHQCDQVYVTKVDADMDADVFFPNLDESPNWEEITSSLPREEQGFQFKFVTYRRIAKD